MPDQNKKLLSIGFVTYNGGVRIRRALDSLFSQTYGNFELIISDNASTDETPDICREYVERDTRARYIRQPENIGRINNFLFVLKKARGDYFMWAANDDWWDPRFAAVLIAGLEKHRDCGVALSSFKRVYISGEALDEISFAGENSTINKSRYALYKKIALYNPAHIFFCGIWRIDFLRDLTRRQIPGCRSWDRILMAEAALVAGFYSADEFLFEKTKNRISLKIRHLGDVEQNRLFKPFSYLRYIFTFLWWMISSPVVPLSRKIFILWPWLALVWIERKRIFGVTLRDARRLLARK